MGQAKDLAGNLSAAQDSIDLGGSAQKQHQNSSLVTIWLGYYAV